MHACTHMRVHAHTAPLSHTVSWFGPNSLDSALKGKFGRENFKQIFNSALPTEEISVLWDSVLSASSRIALEWKEVTAWCRAEQEKALHQRPSLPPPP